MTTEGQLWALTRGHFPVLSVMDQDAVHRLYGGAFGPWWTLTVVDEDERPVVSLCLGAHTKPLVAMRQVANDWRKISASSHPGDDRIPTVPDPMMVRDVALSAPHGLLVARGFARLCGVTWSGDRVSGDLELK